jgi:hypothetical protein
MYKMFTLLCQNILRMRKHPYFRDRGEGCGVVSTLISPARRVGEEPCPFSPHRGFLIPHPSPFSIQYIFKFITILRMLSENTESFKNSNGIQAGFFIDEFELSGIMS